MGYDYYVKVFEGDYGQELTYFELVKRLQSNTMYDDKLLDIARHIDENITFTVSKIEETKIEIKTIQQYITGIDIVRIELLFDDIMGTLDEVKVKYNGH